MRFEYQAFWISFLAASLVAWPVLQGLRRLKALSIISQYAPQGHQQKQGTPSMGGWITLAGCMAAAAFGAARTELPPQFWTGVWLLLAFAVVGFLDDFIVPRFTQKRGISWIPKLILEAFAVSPLLFNSSIPNPWLAAFWVLFFANAVNFSDGLDGLAGGLLLLTLPVLGSLAVGAGALALAIAGGLVPFLFLNAPPARVFMGDVGSLAFGAVYGFLFALSPWDSSLAPWILSLVFILELLLVPIQILAVKTIKRRVFPATPIHHAFEVKGWPESRVVWTFLLVQVVLSASILTEVVQ
ncbi:MAG: phospho-N-acetylmuramoyl-pentapeptide-transferase [Fimbriimonadales bacterium]|nr:MAG: phospho-N-acetylmuramoyl-pentapeptide-transferase [Fimbriimonadales bacterium]